MAYEQGLLSGTQVCLGNRDVLVETAQGWTYPGRPWMAYEQGLLSGTQARLGNRDILAETAQGWIYPERRSCTGCLSKVAVSAIFAGILSTVVKKLQF